MRQVGPEERSLLGIIQITKEMIKESNHNGAIDYSFRGIRSKKGSDRAQLTIRYSSLPVLVVTLPHKGFETDCDLTFETMLCQDQVFSAAVHTMGASGLRSMIYQALDGKGPVTVTLGSIPPSVSLHAN